MHVTDTFDDTLDPRWRITELGAGRVRPGPGGLQLTVPPTAPGDYSDAQISDYRGDDFIWAPPLRLTVQARFLTSTIHGTAGFGFWNQPFMPGQIRLRLPQAIWFFYSSPPSDMRLAHGVPGPGWKAATIDASRLPFLLLAPTTPVGVLLMRSPALYDTLWPIGQRALGVSEALLDPALLTETHTYTLDWLPNGASFAVDGVTIHHAPYAPRGLLGFVAWVDNQYAVVTPQGQIGFGLLEVATPQTLILESVMIHKISASG